jgi:glycosyltransferase involved in cell wall biosynthesis
MSLLIVSGIFHPEIGGPATYLHALAHTLAVRGAAPIVLAYGESRPDLTYPFEVHRVSRRSHPAARLLRFAWTLVRLGDRADLWYVNDYGLPALLASRIRRPTIVMKIVGDFAWEYSRRHGLTTDGIDEFQTRRYGGRIRALKRLQATYVRSAQRIIVPSRYLAGLVEGWGVPADRIRVIYNAVDLDAETRVSIEPPHGGPIILTAGRLAPWKGMDRLLDVVARVRNRIPDVRLVVAGDGPMETDLRAAANRLGIGQAVTWLGGVSRGELLSWMEASQLFVLLSEYEGFSHVALEAMNCGLPVALSRTGGNPELVTHGHDGLLLDRLDHAGAADAIATVLAEESRRLVMASEARRRAGDFRWPDLIDQTLAVFAEVQPTAVSSRAPT